MVNGRYSSERVEQPVDYFTPVKTILIFNEDAMEGFRIVDVEHWGLHEE